jgi:hypothetical protein
MITVTGACRISARLPSMARSARMLAARTGLMPLPSRPVQPTADGNLCSFWDPLN